MSERLETLKKARQRMIEDRDTHVKVLAAPFDRDKAERARNKFIEIQALIELLHPNGGALPKLHQGTAYAETCQAYRARDQRGTAIGILPDREWERAAALRSANRTPNEGTGAEVPSHKLVDHRKDGARRSCGGNH